MCDLVLLGEVGAQFAALREAVRCEVGVGDRAVVSEVVEALSMADEVDCGGHFLVWRSMIGNVWSCRDQIPALVGWMIENLLEVTKIVYFGWAEILFREVDLGDTGHKLL